MVAVLGGFPRSIKHAPRKVPFENCAMNHERMVFHQMLNELRINPFMRTVNVQRP